MTRSRHLQEASTFNDGQSIFTIGPDLWGIGPIGNGALKLQLGIEIAAKASRLKFLKKFCSTLVVCYPSVLLVRKRRFGSQKVTRVKSIHCHSTGRIFLRIKTQIYEFNRKIYEKKTCSC